MKNKKLPVIMITDDDRRYLNLIGRLFKGALKAEIRTEIDSGKALEEALKEPPLIFLTDIMHTGPNGVEILKKLKKTEKTKDVQVWVISGNIPKVFKPAYLEKLGADIVMSKPCSLLPLLQEAERLIKKHAKTQPALIKPINTRLKI